jgi:hypothetical protein
MQKRCTNTEKRDEEVFKEFKKLLSPDLKRMPIYKKIAVKFYLSPGGVRNIINRIEKRNSKTPK